ncbi:structural protein [Bacillus phage vB_BauM_KLEB27-3]|nr:structural protein [Bacillus phage vB_BauM_KLEB27-3]
MENQFNLNIKSEILEKQAKYLFDRAYSLLGETASEEEVMALVDETISRYYKNLGRPLHIVRKAEEAHLPFIEDYNESIEEIVEDVSILFSEIENIGNYLSEYFNYAQSEKMRIGNRIKGISGLTNDLNLIANDTTSNSIYFRDSFEDTTKIEEDMIMGSPAQVSTIEGIVTLGRSSTVNRSESARVREVSGNGEAGTYHVARRVKVPSEDGQSMVMAPVYVSDQLPNDQSQAILDGRPDTIFEYQMVNCERSDIINIAKGYDFSWAKGSKDNDRLRLKIVIQLEEPTDINWININPYNPTFSTGKVVVHSIRTSEDGFDYSPLYEGGDYVLNAEINTTPQTYRADAIFDGSTEFVDSKFAGQGVWVFPTRQTKYVEVILDQNESYEELVGHTYYERIKSTIDGNGNEIQTKVRIPSSQVPDTIIESDPGTYTVDTDTDIKKTIEAFNGWRYAIGIRDINIMSYQFVEKSEIVSKKYETDQEISQIMLYVNEKIPTSYLGKISTSNDWIKYYISYDDVNWIRISPMHHQPSTKETFPPKIVQFNGNKIELESSFQLYKSYVDTDAPVKGIRLKAVLERPTEEGSESTTPVIEDYAIRVVFKDQSVE